MSQFARAKRGATRHWSLTGLVMVLAIFGHDLLMAAPARATPIPTPASRHQAPSHSASHRDSADMDPVAPAPHHLQGCGIGQSAVPRAGDEPEVIAAAIAPRGIGQTISAQVLAAFAFWHEPGCSAGRRRALLQVYRI